MFNIEKINLDLSFSFFFFLTGLALIAIYTIFIYRYTIPKVDSLFKYFLIAIRTLALVLILFAIFEPVLSITRKNIIEPVNLFFIDNSKSIKIEDGTNRSSGINKFINDAKSNDLLNNSNLFSFGSAVKKVTQDSLQEINFNEPSTNFSKLFSSIKNDENNIASISIISDGVITDGANPLYQAEKSGIPIFTIGVGDTTKKSNLAISKVLLNDYIYAETPTTINVSISNTGFKNKTIALSFFEDNLLVNKQDISFTNEEEKTASIIYTPKKPGEKKLTFTISGLSGEFSIADNKNILYANIFNNKINVLILAGSPSADLSFIKNSLSSDQNLRISGITQISQNRFLESVDKNKLIDSADVLYLVGFPSSQTPDDLLKKVLQTIQNKSKPFFLITSSGIDYNKLKLIQSELPFTIKTITSGTTEIQPNITYDEMENPLLKSNSANIIEAWNNLPPVYKDNVEFTPKPESKILAKVKINNIPFNSPLIILRKLGNKKSIALLAKDVWKWKLQTAEKNLDLFDRFILGSVKWMNTREDQKLVSIKTTKKIYSLGEPVEFTSQVYNETLNPIDDAEITIDIKSEKESYKVNMNSLGSGIYEGTLITNKSGDYTFYGNAKLKSKILGTDNGKFSIGDVDVEFINPRMDKDFLNLLASQTGGRFFYGNNYSQLFETIKNLSGKKSNIKLIKSEYRLWSSEWLLTIVILLFALEWFFRKRSGML